MLLFMLFFILTYIKVYFVKMNFLLMVFNFTNIDLIHNILNFSYSAFNFTVQNLTMFKQKDF